MGQRPVAPSAPELVLETDGDSQVMSPSRDYHVGRDPLSDIVIDDDRVSWHHAVLRPLEGHWTLEDENSTNGTYADGRRVDAVGRRPRQRHPLRQPRRRPLRGSRRPYPAGRPLERPAPTPLRGRPPRRDRHLPAGRRPYARCPPGRSASAAPPTTTWSSTT